jgi:isopenicillin N synthase-like dioxygenase
MSTTATVVAQPQPQYEYFFRDGTHDNKREIPRGDRAVKTFEEVPLVGVGNIFSEDYDDRMQVAREVADVGKSVGFMYITNHGISQDLIDEVFELSRRYHAQPLEVKKQQDVYKSPTLRGYEIHYTKTPDGEAGERREIGLLVQDFYSHQLISQERFLLVQLRP